MEGMSVADYLAIDKNHSNGGFGFGDSGFLWVILIFLFFLAFSGNGFGTNNGTLPQVDRDVLTTSSNTQKEILESRYNTQLGFQDMQGRLDSCCLKVWGNLKRNLKHWYKKISMIFGELLEHLKYSLFFIPICYN